MDQRQTIRLRALGALDIRGADGEPLRSVLAQPKRAALFIYLALAAPPRAHRRDTLLALLWPEQDAEHGRNALSQAVHFLRRALGGDVLASTGADEIELDRTKLWCDVLAFEEAFDGGRPAEAADLYRGELLEGFHIGGAPEFERWLELERARLGEVYTRAVEAVAEEREAAGDFRSAALQWRRLASRDPYSSRIALRLMRALAAAGDQAGAVQHARVHETLLREELDVAPDPSVTAFANRLRAGNGRADALPATPSSAPSPLREAQLPASPTARESSAPETPAERVSATRVSGRDTRRRRTVLAGSTLLIAFAATAAMVFRTGAAESAIRSIAVLPFEDLSGDSLDRRHAEVMHDVLVTELARSPGLRVISRASVLRYRDSLPSIPEIAEELDVDGIVQATVFRDGGRLRMTAKLLHGPSDRHIWADILERDVRDMLAMQSELAADIARRVHVAAESDGRPFRAPVGPRDSVPEEVLLRELYAQGRSAELSRGWEGIQTAKAAYRRAAELDSTFALGWAGLAGIHHHMADYAYAPVQPSLDTALMLARRAVALDSMLSDTRTALAVALADAGDFAGAERELKRAIELEPSNARARYWYSVLLVALGRGQEALDQANLVLSIDPHSPRGALAMQRYATFLLTGERPHFQLPVTSRRPILTRQPGEPWARAREAEELSAEGRCTEAHTEIERARRLVPEGNARMLPYVGTVHWRCGNRERARAILADMQRRADAHDQGYRIALLYVVIGEHDSALVWLGRHRWTIGELSGLSAGAQLDPLRSDPRFHELLQRLGIRPRRSERPAHP